MNLKAVLFGFFLFIVLLSGCVWYGGHGSRDYGYDDRYPYGHHPPPDRNHDRSDDHHGAGDHSPYSR